MEKNMFEWVGYLASVLVAVSLTIKGGVYFRILNMAGSICFFFYGLAIGSFPVKFINLYCVGINIYYLIKLRQANKANKENT